MSRDARRWIRSGALLLLAVGLTACSLRMDFPAKPVRGSALDLGYGFSCSLTVDQEVACWGYSPYGEIGLPVDHDEGAPLTNTLIEPPVLQVVAGGSHACARSAQGVWCWGRNEFNQVASGPAGSYDTPARILDPDGVTHLAAGSKHSCAVRSGQVLCWGQNQMRQAGGANEAETVPEPTPVPFPPGVELTRVALGWAHSCAVDTKGGVWCWGRSTHGQLGQGADVYSLGLPECEEFTRCTDVPLPVTAVDASAVEITAGGDHTCALYDDGEIRCWGGNGDMECGYEYSNEDDHRTTWVPFLVTRPAGAWDEVVAGGQFTCARTGGTAYCWGSNDRGELGQGTTLPERSALPQQIPLQDVRTLAAGFEHICALAGERGELYCWGDNQYGQISWRINQGLYVATPTRLMWK